MPRKKKNEVEEEFNEPLSNYQDLSKTGRADPNAKQGPSSDLTVVLSSEPAKERISIKKASIKNELFLLVEYEESGHDGTASVKKDCKAPVHDDMKVAYRKLDVHLARIAEQFDQRGGLDSFNCNCSGFTIGGAGESEGVSLIGYRGLDTGAYLNLVSPFLKWTDPYKDISELAQIIEECKHEVKLYLLEGKHQPSAQLEMFVDEEEEFSEPAR